MHHRLVYAFYSSYTSVKKQILFMFFVLSIRLIIIIIIYCQIIRKCYYRHFFFSLVKNITYFLIGLDDWLQNIFNIKTTIRTTRYIHFSTSERIQANKNTWTLFIYFYSILRLHRFHKRITIITYNIRVYIYMIAIKFH